MTKYASAPEREATVERMERDAQRADEEYDFRSQQESFNRSDFMSDLSKELFSTVDLFNNAARIHIKLGRAQFCEEVRRIIGTASARKPFPEVINELIALCNREVKP